MNVYKADHSYMSPNALMLGMRLGQDHVLANTAHNLANADTPGFRSFVTSLNYAETNGPENNKVSYPTSTVVHRNEMTGSMVSTGKALDFAINGEGYFAVDGGEAGRLYTRNGRFTNNAAGQLVTMGTFRPVLNSDGGPIQINGMADKLHVGSDGTMTLDGETIGRLGVFTFDNEQALQKADRDYYRAAGQGPNPIDNSKTKIVHKSYEGSNASPVLELTKLMEVEKQVQFAEKITKKNNDHIQTFLQIRSTGG